MQALTASFFQSPHGQQAFGQLTQQGFAPQHASNLLSHALGAGATHVHEHASSGGLLGDHPGRSFFAAFAAGLVRGDGVFGALEDGAVGVVSAKITEALCYRAGIDPNTASMVSATATPYVMGFLRDHLGHRR